MDTNTFIIELIKSLAWPTTLLLSILLLRGQLSKVLPLISKLKYREFELHFEREIAKLKQSAEEQLPETPKDIEHEKVRDRLLQLAIASPQTAVIEAWRHVENRLVEVGRASKIDVAPPVWTMPMVLAALMLKEGIFTEAQYSMLRSIKDLRNEAAHSANMELSAVEVGGLIDLAIRLAASMK